MPAPPLIAVDIGNARIKCGLFRSGRNKRTALPEPERTLQLPGGGLASDQLASWLEEIGQRWLWWWIGSVNRPATTRLLDWLRACRPADPLTLLAAGDLPLVVNVERPDMVGVDRLLDAVAANRLRAPKRPAVVVDVGTATTVDLVSAEGAFLGGAILPGIEMSARAMHQFTDLLPLIEVTQLGTPPPAVGTATIAAMQSGLFWGAVGGIRELIGQFAKELGSRPHVFLTGGAGPVVAKLLGRGVRYVPHLTLAGIAIAAEAMRPGGTGVPPVQTASTGKMPVPPDCC
jgi:type III pantothenate kinase